MATRTPGITAVRKALLKKHTSRVPTSPRTPVYAIYMDNEFYATCMREVYAAQRSASDDAVRFFEFGTIEGFPVYCVTPGNHDTKHPAFNIVEDLTND